MAKLLVAYRNFENSLTNYGIGQYLVLYVPDTAFVLQQDDILK